MSDAPGCYYDTTDCTGNCCKAGKEMYERYLEEEYGEIKLDINELREKKIKRILNENKKLHI